MKIALSSAEEIISLSNETFAEPIVDEIFFEKRLPFSKKKQKSPRENKAITVGLSAFSGPKAVINFRAGEL